jgi:hypothetical protein
MRKSVRPTERQALARRRNWHIFRLRGLYANSHPMCGEHLVAYLAAIDAQLIEMGAESESARQARFKAEREEELRDLEDAPYVSNVVACQRKFAWLPVELWDGGTAWLRTVYRINTRSAVWYSLVVPRNAL